MISNIRQAMSDTIHNVEWMDDYTKDSALDKLDKMLQMVAYPDEIVDLDAMKEYYQGLTITKEDFFANVLEMNR